MLTAGTVLLNKYRIDRVIGQGGMGMVALAQHLVLQQPVAIKLLLPEVLDKHTVVQRFLREAQASGRLRSEHVCRVIDVGQLDNGAPYMVMEYLEGLDLEALLRHDGPLPVGDAVDFVLQACEALAEAHALGIIHRDLKPANFFLTRRADGSALIKVLDFGISKTISEIDEGLTTTQAILGTPAYMSPEQLKASKHVDARSDIWALGVVLFELLAGQRPFSASSFSELVLKVAMDPAPSPPIDLPAGLAALVQRCLEKDPDLRFANVAELVAHLAPYAGTPSIAQSAVERTARIATSGVAAGSFPRAPSSPRAGAFGTAETAPMRAGAAAISGVEPTVNATPSPSTMNAASGELVRPAPALPAPAASRRRMGKTVVVGAALALAIAVGLIAFRGEDAGKSAPNGRAAAPMPPAQLGSSAAAPTSPSAVHGTPAGVAAAPAAVASPPAAVASPPAAVASPPAAAAEASAAPSSGAGDEPAVSAPAKDPPPKKSRKRRKPRTDSTDATDDEEEVLGSRQ